MLNNKLLTLALAGAAVLFMIVVQFAPWATYKEDVPAETIGGFTFGGGTFEVTAFTWAGKVAASGNSESEGWYDNNWKDADGIGLMRASPPIFLAGMVAVVAGVVLGALRPGTLGNTVTLAGGILLSVGLVLFSIGTSQFFDETDYVWHVSFYFAIAACVCALAAGVVALLNPTSNQNATF